VIEIELTDYQERWLNSAERIAVLQGGAGCGKTFVQALAVHLLPQMMPGSRGVYVAAKYPQMHQSFVPHWLALADKLGVNRTWNWHKQHNQVDLPNGSTYWLRSAEDPGSLLATDAAWVVGDEIGLWKRLAYQYSLGRLRMPGYRHRMLLGYTPKGMASWAYEEFRSSRPGVEVIRGAQNPFIAQEYYDSLASEYGTDSAIYRQEVLGEYVSHEGLVYPEFSRDIHVADGPIEPIPGRPIYLGIDWGVVNPTVVLVVQLGPSDSILVLRERRYTGMPASATAKMTLDWLVSAGLIEKGARPPNMYRDRSGKSETEEWRRVGFGVRAGKREVTKGIDDLHKAMAVRGDRPLLVIDPRCYELIDELCSYAYEGRGEKILKEADHGPDALRYVVSGLWPKLRMRPAPKPVDESVARVVV
jgi:phage terminase large subunit